MKKLVISILAIVTLFLMNSVSVMAVTQEQLTSQQAQVESLTREIAELDKQSNTLEKQIEEQNKKIDQTIQELFKAQSEEAELKEASKDRIRAAYMYGTEGYLEALFSAKNPSDFISYYDVTKDILKADRESLQDLKKKKEEIQKLQADQVKQRNDMVNNKIQIESTRSAKNTLLQTNKELVAQLQELMRQQNILNQLENQNNNPVVENTAPIVTIEPAQQQGVSIQQSSPSVLIESTEQPAQESAQTQDVAQSSSAMILPAYAAEQMGTDKIEDEKNPEEENQETNTNPYMVEIPSTNGTLTLPTQEVPQSWYWPIDANDPNAFVITSMMGTRESPGGIGSTDHQGTDIGASYGTAILAAQSGTVTKAESTPGYGNVVVIDHGNGYVTTYGHMSTIAVTVGQQVQGGQIIGFVGSTGWSTGPHLHFEVHFIDNTGTDSVINGLSLYGQDIYNRLTFSN